VLHTRHPFCVINESEAGMTATALLTGSATDTHAPDRGVRLSRRCGTALSTTVRSLARTAATPNRSRRLMRMMEDQAKPNRFPFALENRGVDIKGTGRRFQQRQLSNNAGDVLALTVGTVAIVLIGFALPVTPLAPVLGFTVPSASYLFFVIVATGAYLLFVEVGKRQLVRRAGAPS
jgi:hypothetical protein